jgi:hypothetical protein
LEKNPKSTTAAKMTAIIAAYTNHNLYSCAACIFLGFKVNTSSFLLLNVKLLQKLGEKKNNQ